MSSPAIDDYLKTVYQHTEWQPEPITPSVLAQRLGVAPSSVTEMVKKLAAAGLVSHVPYGPLRLTDDGTARALAIIRRHRLIETWLVGEMGYSWDEVHEEAEVLEHALSDRLLDAIDHRLGRPAFDPHGDRIPTATGEIRQPDAVLLSDAPDGYTGAVLRVSDRDPDVLRAVTGAGITIGQMLTVGAGSVIAAGTEVTLPDAARQAVWLSA